MINKIKNYELVLSGEENEERLLLTFDWDDFTELFTEITDLSENEMESQLIPKHAILDKKLLSITVVFNNRSAPNSQSYIVNFVDLPNNLFELVDKYNEIVIVGIDAIISEEIKLFFEVPLNVAEM